MLKYFGGAPIIIDCGPHGNMQEEMEYLERKEKREKAEERRDYCFYTQFGAVRKVADIFDYVTSVLKDPALYGDPETKEIALKRLEEFRQHFFKEDA